MNFDISGTKFSDVVLVRHKLQQDKRGYFFESFNEKAFTDITGRSVRFVQDNQSKSERGVLRGLHYQVNEPQGKLLHVVKGNICF